MFRFQLVRRNFAREQGVQGKEVGWWALASALLWNVRSVQGPACPSQGWMPVHSLLLPSLTSPGLSSTFPPVPNLDHQEDPGQQVTVLSEKIVLAYSCDKWQSHHIVPNFSVPELARLQLRKMWSILLYHLYWPDMATKALKRKARWVPAKFLLTSVSLVVRQQI